MRNIVYFDLETQKSADEVGGWARIRDMRMSVGVTFSTERDGYRIYGEGEVNALIDELRRADLVVGFNSLRFDYEVLAGHNPFFDAGQIPTLDMLVDLQQKLAAPSVAGRHRAGDAGSGEDRRRDAGHSLVQGGPPAGHCRVLLLRRKDNAPGPPVRRIQKHLHYLGKFGKKMTVPVAWAGG